MNKYVLLLRGINVNPSTRVAMSDLRDILTELGYRGVKTLLQSGNVVLSSPAASDAVPDVAPIEAAVAARTGVTSRIVALPVTEFRAIVEANPLLTAGDDLSKLVITFVGGSLDPSAIERPTDDALAPERLVVATRAVYQWCPDGILQSKLKPAWWKQFTPVITARNVRTANRILDLADLE